MLRAWYIFLSVAKTQIPVAITELGTSFDLGEDQMCEAMHLSHIWYNISKYNLRYGPRKYKEGIFKVLEQHGVEPFS
jgi:hypothetical protein